MFTSLAWLLRGDCPQGPGEPPSLPFLAATVLWQGKFYTTGLGLPWQEPPHAAVSHTQGRLSRHVRPGGVRVGGVPQNRPVQGAARQCHSRLEFKWPRKGQPPIPTSEKGTNSLAGGAVRCQAGNCKVGRHLPTGGGTL